MVSETLIGIVPDDWKQTTLGEICKRGGGDIQTGPFGSQLHAADYVSVGIPSIMPQNIGDNRIVRDGIARITLEDAERLSRYRVRSGDVVYSRRGDVERRSLIREEEDGWLCGTGCLRVRFGDGVVDPLFASYYLGHPSVREWIVRHAVGATMPNLNTSILSALPFVAPALSEQKDIAQVIGAFDDKIELNRQMNATLEAMAQALFKSWFVDFDPVKAKAAGRAPEGMDADTAALFPSELVESELGLIPKGWEIVSLDRTFDVVGGGTPKTSNPDFWNGEIPWFSVVDAPAETDVFVIDTEKRITQLGLNSCSSRLLKKGATIISARGTVGRLAIVATPMAMNQSCYALNGKYGDYFNYYSIKGGISTLKQNTHGAVFDTITRDTFKTVTTVQPQGIICREFEKQISPLMQQLETNVRQSRTLASIRDTLLPKLISGQLRIPEAEALAEAAL